MLNIFKFSIYHNLSIYDLKVNQNVSFLKFEIDFGTKVEKLLELNSVKWISLVVF